MKDVTIYEANNRVYTQDQEGHVLTHVVLTNGEIMLEYGLPKDDVPLEPILNGVAEESFEDWTRRQIDKGSSILQETMNRVDLLELRLAVQRGQADEKPNWEDAVPMHSPDRPIAIRVSRSEREIVLGLRNGSLMVSVVSS